MGRIVFRLIPIIGLVLAATVAVMLLRLRNPAAKPAVAQASACEEACATARLAPAAEQRRPLPDGAVVAAAAAAPAEPSWCHPPEEYWLRLRAAVAEALQALGREAFRERAVGDVEERLAQLREGAAPGLLPDPEWLRLESSSWIKGVILGEAWRLLPATWERWARVVLARSVQDPGVEAGILWASMAGSAGPIAVSGFQKYFREYHFLGGSLGPCRLEWVRELAREILLRADARSEREIWTQRSLAALALADRYEQGEGVRALLAPCLGEGVLLDVTAHPGAVRGLCAYGGEHARSVLQRLLVRPRYWGRPMVIAWGNGLLAIDGEESPALRCLRQLGPEDRFVAFDTTEAALEAYAAGGGTDAALLAELLDRALDAGDRSVERAVLLHRLLEGRLDPASGSYLAVELSFQDRKYCAHLPSAALALKDSKAPPEELAAFLADLAALAMDSAGNAQALAIIETARAILDAP
ncbi:MAG: hypothetical protein EYC70_11220 [Planctomycetota bacterium]|nr:MAG: hypothetical protein EYC70_11220 [Planctomycetota bacterium]